MKQLFFFLAALLLLAFAYQGKKIPVNIKVLQSSSYCGGAEISPEEMAEISKPRPHANKKCFVRKGSKNDVKAPVVATFTSDANGNFTLSLPPGEYCIVDSRKYDKKYIADIARKYKKAGQYYSAADLNCLKAWLVTPDAVFIVKEEGENKIEVNYYTPCGWDTTPCIQYDGPLPP